MKIINETSCDISPFVYQGILHVNVKHKDKCWVGGTEYRGGGRLYFINHPDIPDSGTHFEVYDEYDPEGTKNYDFHDRSKIKSFCLIGENDREVDLMKGIWYRTQDKETEMFVCIPHAKDLKQLHDIEHLA